MLRLQQKHNPRDSAPLSSALTNEMSPQAFSKNLPLQQPAFQISSFGGESGDTFEKGMKFSSIAAS